MAEINFRGREMNLLEAKLILFGLRAHLISPNLNEEEKKNYVKNNESVNEKKSSGIGTFSSEREYLIHELDSAIEISKEISDREYCLKNGHTEGELINSKYNCKKCGVSYIQGAYGQEI